MAVQRLADYTRRIWTGLSADESDPDMQAGDVIYYMDTSTCSIITGIPAPGSIDTEDLPDIGGGGGRPVLTKLGYGDYTVTTAASSVTIPVTHTGTVDIISYIKDSVMASINQVYSGIRQLTPPAVDNVASFLVSSSNFGVYSQYSANGARLFQGANTTGGSLITYTGTTSAMTGITIQRQASTIQVQPGTYHWELWGYKS